MPRDVITASRGIVRPHHTSSPSPASASRRLLERIAPHPQGARDWRFARSAASCPASERRTELVEVTPSCPGKRRLGAHGAEQIAQPAPGSAWWAGQNARAQLQKTETRSPRTCLIAGRFGQKDQNGHLREAPHVDLPSKRAHLYRTHGKFPSTLTWRDPR